MTTNKLTVTNIGRNIYKPNLVSPRHKAKVRIKPKKDLVDQTGKTFYFVCNKCNRACDPVNKDSGTVLATCFSIDCPERKSLCCGTYCTRGEKGEPEFICKNCRNKFQGGECNYS